MQSINYSVFEPIKLPRPVDRLSFLESQARGKRIFDLGALDETAYQTKKTTTNWLHARLCRSARQVVGIDNSLLIPTDGLATSQNSQIIRADIYNLSNVVASHGAPEMIIAGELIEHLPDTGAFLASLKSNPHLKGAQLLVSTPNACCWHNFLVGLAGRESMHKDHLQVYSYKTLRTLFERQGFEIELIQPYYARFPEIIEGSKAPVAVSARLFQGLVNTVETLTPILSAGWIVQTRI